MGIKEGRKIGRRSLWGNGKKGNVEKIHPIHLREVLKERKEGGEKMRRR